MITQVARPFPHEPPVDPATEGLDARAVHGVFQQFKEQQRLGRFPGGQLAVRRHGRLVLDDAVGFARGAVEGDDAPLLRTTPSTPFPVFSAGKPLIAICIAILEERGLLDVNAPIASVWPEFAAHGKEHITTLDVLTHRGGIIMPEFIRRPRDWLDWNRVVDAVCATRPTWRRGVLAYHPFEYGWVLAEIVRRVAGRPLPEFLFSEFTGPAGLPGLRFGVTPEELQTIARTYWMGGGSVYIHRVNVADLFTEIHRSPEILTAFIPGAGMITDAAHLTAFYDILLAGGVAHDGRRLLAERTVRLYTERHAAGWCRSNRAPLAVGRGFLLGTTIPSPYGWWDTTDCFGHAGAFCTVAFADRRTSLSVAFITNANRGPTDLIRRFTTLAGRLRSSAIAT